MTWLDSLPRWATLAALAVTAVATIARGAWPSLAESLVLTASVALVYGALRRETPAQRLACAALWVGVLAVLGLVTPRQNVGADFWFFWDGAELLFGRRQSPYALGSTAFPFPTFLLVRGLSLGGRLGAEPTLGLFTALSLGGLLVSVPLMRRVVRAEVGREPDRARSLLQAGLILHPAVLAGIAIGQSVALAGALVVLALWLWRCPSGRWSLHAAALSLNLAWMLKPQLLPAAGFFVAAWLLDGSRGRARGRAAGIGRVLLPWALVLTVVPLGIAFPGHVLAYRDFPAVAAAAHTVIAETFVNNYALSAILAKTLARFAGVAVALSLPLLAAGIAALVVGWNLVSLVRARADSLRAFLPWIYATFLWSSIVWELYLTLALAGLMLLIGLQGERGRAPTAAAALEIALAVGATTVLTTFAFTAGVLLLYFQSHAMVARE